MTEEIIKENVDKQQQTGMKGHWDSPFASMWSEGVICSLFVNKNLINHTFKGDRTVLYPPLLI